ncbi:MAG: CBS domain-containing protein [Bacillota bacterium]|nr:CBS domain-containing protein [Bacillota bacterium]
MNVAFFLTPKNDVVCETLDSTMRQALERMEYHRYSAIPIIDQEGRYVGTLTEGDLLWKLKNTPELNFKNTSKILIGDIPRHIDNKPVNISANIEDLVSLSVNQNFVPVVDDNGVFIGIIKRSDIINYCYKLLLAKRED